MRWWGVLTASGALVFLVGGCAVATALQPPSFNWVASTVSTLTEREAADPWMMTTTFAVTGACEMATALALRPAAMPAAAVATLLQPGRREGSVGLIPGGTTRLQREAAASASPDEHRDQIPFWSDGHRAEPPVPRRYLATATESTRRSRSSAASSSADPQS